MEFTNFELELNSINNKISEFFAKIEATKLLDNQEFLKILGANLEEKAKFINSLEEKLTENVNSLETELNQIEDDIIKLDINKIPKIHDIKKLKRDAEAASNENLKAVFLNLKKKKMETTHKISSLRKDLANFHKDNSSKLIEEEKNYKFRITEFERRLNIDIERKFDANIKDYSDFEKTLLETNDETLIFELKKRIKAIRIEGLEDLNKLKDKYAYLEFENSFDFQKFKEKIILENSTKLEENKIMVHGLETEKTLLEIEENYLSDNSELLIAASLLDYELENEINDNNLRLDYVKKQVELRLDGLEKSKVFSKNKKSAIVELQRETFMFDLSQLNRVLPYSFNVKKNNLDIFKNITENINQSIEIFKNSIIAILFEFNDKRNYLDERFITTLLSFNKDKTLYTDYEFSVIRDNLAVELVQFQKEQTQLLKKVHNGICGIVDNILSEVKKLSGFMDLYLDYYYSLEIKHINRIEDILYNSFDAAVKSNNQEYSDFNSDADKELKEIRKMKDSAIKYQKENELKIREAYRLKRIDIENKLLELEEKLNKDKEIIEFESREFVSNSRKKIDELRTTSGENILRHEKELHNEYKRLVALNEAEKKARTLEL